MGLKIKLEGYTTFTKGHILEVLENLTINNIEFEPDYWSIEDGKTLIKIGEMIIKEVELKDKERRIK